MANLPETATWDAGVYQLETTDPVLGGPNGTSNAPLKNLANRTAYLKQQVEAKAPLASPVMTGTPTAPTAAAATNTTQVATTAFVKNAVASAVTSVAGRTGAVTLAVADVSGAAPLLSPALTGAPSAPTPTAGDSTTKVATTAFVAAAFSAASPAGMVAHFARNAAPTGWLKANGAAISRSTYASLFSAIGTTFGAGDNSTTFNVPDLRGEFLRSWDDGRGIDLGRLFGAFQADELKSHSHKDPTSNGTQTTLDGYQVPAPNYLYPYDYVDGAETSTFGGTETRPRNIALLACIKY